MHRLLLVGVLSIPLLAQDAILEHARQVNLERASHMPNFVADERATFYGDGKGSGKWEPYSTVTEEEITVKGNQISRRDFRRDGKQHGIESTTRKRGFTPGRPATGFAAALQPLFDPNCPTTLKFAGNDELRGKAVLAYQFDSPANGCVGDLYVYRNTPYNAARTGRILIDGPGGDVLQFEEEAFGFPERFNVVTRRQVMNWDYVKIGEASHWLPVSAEFIWALRKPVGSRSRTGVEYRNHRHFESATDIKYK
jgi:hypothetical protein